MEIEGNQEDILKALADQKIPPSSPEHVICSNESNDTSVKLDSVPTINLELVYEDKGTTENEV